jgi:hypothetical protein
MVAGCNYNPCKPALMHPIEAHNGLDNPTENKYLWAAIQKLLKNEPEAKFFVLPVKREHFAACREWG